MVPLRDETTMRLLKSFKDVMDTQELPLTCIEEGNLDGQDDWDEAEEGSLVRCWWGIFARKQQV